jgi:prepilin-type N-terminal cleavage/methylation domain-containing protein
MKTTDYSPGKPQGRGENQVRQASRQPSTLDKVGSPQPSLDSTSSRAARRYAPAIVVHKLCLTPFLSPFVFFDSVATAQPPFRPIYDYSISRLPRQSVVSSVVRSSAFSLVELLVVMAIIGMMVGLSALAVQGMRAPAVQHAADQVTSGLSLARQVAITKNTYAALLIANQTNAGFPTNGPYRHWSVVYSNKSSSGNWTIAKDWEELPTGAFFLEILRNSGSAPQKYSSLSKNDFSLYSIGNNFTPNNFFTNNFSIINAVSGSTTNTVITGQSIPCLIFSSSGTATNNGVAIRIAQGNVMSGNATLTSTNQYFFIETDSRTGRIRMRSPENYY